LATLVRQQPGSTKPTVVTSLRHPRDAKNDHAVLAEALGRLWASGLPIDWKTYFAAEHRRRVELPTYPFERKRYWIAAQSPSAPSANERADLADWFYVKSWTRSMPPKPVSALRVAADRRRWLLFADEGGLAARIDRALRPAHDVVLVEAAG